MNVEAYTPIANLEEDKQYNQIFLIASIVWNPKMKTSNGLSFAKVSLKDITGELNGAIWGYDGSLNEGDYVRMNVETKIYKGEIEFQAHIQDVVRCKETPINQHDYVHGINPTTLSTYMSQLETNISSLSDEFYRDIMNNAVHRLGLLATLRDSPYGLDGPMSYRGGLLVHVTNTIRFSSVALQHATEFEIPINSSLVVAGCVLRNIGWHTTTLFKGDHLRARDAHYMIGIQRASARYMDHLFLTCENDLQIQIPEAKKQALENMCSERANIRTLEGQIVASADQMADILDFGANVLQRKQNGNWADDLFVGHL